MNNDNFVEMHGFVVDLTSPEGFVFNENGVCLNPERIEIYDSKKYYIAVKLCCYNGFWDYGYEFTCRHGNYSGCSGPCGHPGPSTDWQARFSDRKLYNQKFYPDREAALYAGLDSAQEFVERVESKNPIPEQRKVFEAILSARTPQLTLF